MRLEYKEVDIETIFKHFIDGFKATDGSLIVRYTAFHDVRKGKVLFELYLEENPNGFK